MKIKLTIIIPYYNSQYNIDKLVGSIPEKNDIEIIIVDDFSDYPPELNANRSNVKIVSQVGQKKWAGGARNKGLELANGEYVLFADADDFFVESAFDFIEDYIQRNFDIVYFTPCSMKSNGSSSLRHQRYSSLVSNFLGTGDDSIRYKFVVPWSKLFKLEFLNKYNIRFDEVIASNDVMFSLKSGFYGDNFYVTKSEIYCVVESNNTLTKVITEEVIDSRFLVFNRYNDFICEKLNSKRQIGAISCISKAYKISFYKMLAVLFTSLHKGYPILPGYEGLKSWFRNTIK
jgi:glycosyltransferase involved in cell wall biosynthesis